MARGSIVARQRKDGTTVYDVMYRTVDGRQIKRCAGASRRAAEGMLSEALAAVRRGELKSASQERFDSYAARWLGAKRPRLEQSTYEDYERHIRLRLLPAFGDLKLRAITRSRIEAYLAALDRGQDLGRKSINDSLIPLRQILGRAVREGIITSNPANSTDRDQPLELPYERPVMRPLNGEEAGRYLEACGPRYRPMAEVLIGGGLRIGEALALEWRDITWETQTLSIERTLKRGGVGTPKSDRARPVAVDSAVIAILREHRHRLVASGRGGVLVFPSTAGTPLGVGNVRKRWHVPTLRRAGLSGVRLHDLRHTAATLWLAAGESIYFVKEQLGHADIQTTINLYGHPDQAEHRAAAERAAAWWRTPAVRPG